MAFVIFSFFFYICIAHLKVPLQKIFFLFLNTQSVDYLFIKYNIKITVSELVQKVCYKKLDSKHKRCKSYEEIDNMGSCGYNGSDILRTIIYAEKLYGYNDEDEE